MKITIHSEPNSNNPFARAQSQSFEITDVEATILIERDHAARSSDLKARGAVKARSVQEILDEEISRPDYNNWHATHRQDRKNYKSTSLEAWNEYGTRAEGSSPSSADAFEADEAQAEQDALFTLIRGLVAGLPEAQHAAVTGVYLEFRQAVDIARKRGVSKAAI